ncbi:MAG: TetR/AcrR family transcriptional regulator [Vicinamibacterales bacterium]
MPRVARVSPERIAAVAALEFSERGYAGARVDRIAKRAKVNKAMLYYHFGSKQGLYRTLLRTTFEKIATELQAIAGAGAPPAAGLATAVATLAAFIDQHTYFPAIMLREVAEGGTHLDASTLAALAAVPQAFSSILQPGIDQGVLRRMHPLAAYFMTIAPILMFVASTPVRRQLSSRKLAPALASTLTTEVFLADLQRSLQLAFSAPHNPTRL